MKNSTYLTRLIGWILSSIFCYFILGMDFELELGIAVGGIAMLTLCWLSTD